METFYIRNRGKSYFDILLAQSEAMQLGRRSEYLKRAKNIQTVHLQG